MTPDRLHELLETMVPDVQRQSSGFLFEYEEVPMMLDMPFRRA